MIFPFTLPFYLLIFSLSFSIFTTFGTLYYSWKIMQMDVTPRGTWSLKVAAMIIQSVTIAWSAFYVNDLLHFLSTYPPTTLLVSYGLSSLRSGLIFGFAARVYYTLRVKFPLQNL